MSRLRIPSALAPVLALSLIGAGALAAQVTTATATQQTAAPAEQNVMLNVRARDYAFDAPVSVNAGLITFHLKNEGTDVHHLVVIQLANGHSIKDFFDAMRDNGVAPAWTKTLGATPTIGRNGDAYVSVRLDAGRYILACLIPASDGRSHVAKGMYQLINVTEKLVADPTMTKTPTKAAAPAKKPAAKP